MYICEIMNNNQTNVILPDVSANENEHLTTILSEETSTNEHSGTPNENVKDASILQDNEQSFNADNLNNVNGIFSSDETVNRQVMNSYNDASQMNNNEVSELDVTNATCESLENVNQSDATLEISNCFSDDNEQVSLYTPSDSFSCLSHEKERDSLRTSVINEELFDIENNESGIGNESDVVNSLDSPKVEKDGSLSSANESMDEQENSRNSSDLSAEYEATEETSESNGSIDLVDMYPNALKWQLREPNPQLPSCVTVLEVPGGSKVYLVGTAHFSTESQDDVAKTIRATQPDIVLLELCKSRMYILAQDEALILEEAKSINLEKIRATIKQVGLRQGILSLLLLSMCAHITRELGMAPGGEFRRAFHEARQIPHCFIQLGDRPIRITMERTMASLSLWKKIRMAWYLLTCREPITREDVERFKNKDLLEKLLSDMAGDFPELTQIMVKERDLYLAYTLRLAAKTRPSPLESHAEESPTIVVGVVGFGHVPGIIEHWDTVAERDIPPILCIPKASRSSRIIRRTICYSLYGLVIYGVYRVTPSSVWQKPINLINRLWNR